MNTFRIYEELRASLGDEAAKSLAQTLGGMFEELRNTVTKEDLRVLHESIDGSISRLDSAVTGLAEAQSRTEARVAELADAQSRTEARVAELAEAQSRTEARVAELADAQSRTEARVAELAEGQQRLCEAQRETEGQVGRLAEAQREMSVAIQRLTIRTDAVVGRTFELQFRDRLTAYLGRFLRRGKLVANDELLETIEPHVDEREAEDFLRADAVAMGLVDGVSTYVVVEVSSTGDVEDIVRAERRAKTLQKSGLASIPLIACDAISPESLAFARMSGVRVWCNGSMMEAAA
jgi:multidrug efflux pump subunit AcrA (membrane-fusion protein)